MRILSLVLVATALGAAALYPQSAPAGWRVIVDGSDAAARVQPDYQFQEMPPGFHITMGPGALIFAPKSRVSGRFSIEAQFFLFPGASSAGYGLFVGATGIDSGEPSYTAFVLRPDGMAGVFRLDGGDTTVYLPWSRPDSVLTPVGDDPGGNRLAIMARGDSVAFLVNGRGVGAIARRAIPVDGQFGYRIGAGLNLHAATLDYTVRLAPVRP